MSEHLTDRLTSTAHALKGSRAYSASVIEDAIAEIERLRTLLSEAEQRGKDETAWIIPAGGNEYRMLTTKPPEDQGPSLAIIYSVLQSEER